MNTNDVLNKLIAEIERQMNECIGRFGEIHKLPEYRCLKNIHSYITSLQREKPEVDLEKEMAAYIERHFHIRYDETLEVGNDPLTTYDFEEIARHFYELGCKQSDNIGQLTGLDEAAEKELQAYLPQGNGPDGICYFIAPQMLAMYKAGAEQMAGQGVSMEITPEVDWTDIDKFVYKHSGDNVIVQIRKINEKEKNE